MATGWPDTWFGPDADLAVDPETGRMTVPVHPPATHLASSVSPPQPVARQRPETSLPPPQWPAEFRWAFAHVGALILAVIVLALIG
ncbi:MAG: hypothetical protein K2X46_17335 [Roseomonas sp.]|nr:hypothetical protein [Roseomonas sp.]